LAGKKKKEEIRQDLPGDEFILECRRVVSGYPAGTPEINKVEIQIINYQKKMKVKL